MPIHVDSSSEKKTSTFSSPEQERLFIRVQSLNKQIADYQMRVATLTREYRYGREDWSTHSMVLFFVLGLIVSAVLYLTELFSFSISIQTACMLPVVTAIFGAMAGGTIWAGCGKAVALRDRIRRFEFDIFQINDEMEQELKPWSATVQRGILGLARERHPTQEVVPLSLHWGRNLPLYTRTFIGLMVLELVFLFMLSFGDDSIITNIRLIGQSFSEQVQSILQTKSIYVNNDFVVVFMSFLTILFPAYLYVAFDLLSLKSISEKQSKWLTLLLRSYRSQYHASTKYLLGTGCILFAAYFTISFFHMGSNSFFCGMAPLDYLLAQATPSAWFINLLTLMLAQVYFFAVALLWTLSCFYFRAALSQTK